GAAHDPLHGRGRAARRPGGGHRPRPPARAGLPRRPRGRRAAGPAAGADPGGRRRRRAGRCRRRAHRGGRQRSPARPRRPGGDPRGDGVVRRAGAAPHRGVGGRGRLGGRVPAADRQAGAPVTAAAATSPAAGPLQRLRAQTAMELRLLLRNGENLLVAFGIPLLVLVFFSLVDVLPTDGRPVDFLVPGVLALSVMSTALVSLGISTGFERYYLVLKRLGATPLRRSELVAAKALAVCAVEAVQVVVVIGVAAWGLGWRASAPRLGLALAAMLAGTAALAGIGLAMAGRLRAVSTLALANVTYVV